MTFVIDACVAIKWGVSEHDCDKARQLLACRDRLIAPELIMAEVAAVASRMVLAKEISNRHALDLVKLIPRAITHIEGHAVLAARACKLAVELSHHAYDCFYLACAELHKGTLVTADEKFVRKVRRYAPRQSIVPLSEFDGEML